MLLLFVQHYNYLLVYYDNQVPMNYHQFCGFLVTPRDISKKSDMVLKMTGISQRMTLTDTSPKNLTNNPKLAVPLM